MRRLLTLAFALLSVSAAPAVAAPLTEIPAQSVEGPAMCLRATGVPGELMRSTFSGVRFLQAGPTGIVEGPKVFEGRYPEQRCPAVAAQPNGAAVFAAPMDDDVIKAAIREPGGGPWSPLSVIRGMVTWFVIQVAVSERGDAAVVWAEQTRDGSRLRIARRTPGGTFGLPSTLSTAPTPDGAQVGISASGDVTVSWTQRPKDELERTGSLMVATAAPGEVFGPPQRVGDVDMPDAPALAVAPDGHALLAYTVRGELRVAERAPGGAFGLPMRVASVTGVGAFQAAAALGDDGRAIVSWFGEWDETVGAVTRTAPGPFSEPIVLSRPVAPVVDRIFFALLRSDRPGLGTLANGGHEDIAGGNLRVLFSPRGGALVTWAGIRLWEGMSSSKAVRAVVLPLAGGHRDTTVAGSPLRDVESAVPMLLADGAPAVAWADMSSDGWVITSRDELMSGHVGLAVEGGASAPDPPPPHVTIGRPRDERRGKPIWVDDELWLPVRCSSACDVRAAVVGRRGSIGGLSLARAGNWQMRLDLFADGRPIAPLRPGPVRIRVFYGAPGTRRPAAKTLTVRMYRSPDGRTPRPLDLRARRSGDHIVVTWRSDDPYRSDSGFIVAGLEKRSDVDSPRVFNLNENGYGDGDVLRATIKPAKGIRYVVIYGEDHYKLVPQAVVRVR